MPRTRPTCTPHVLLTATACSASLIGGGCTTQVRIPDAPPVDEQPVTKLAGYGMELRTWALDATSWKRARSNEELEALYREWLAIEAQRAADEEPDAAPIADQAGPPAEPDDGWPATFEQFAATRSEASIEQPGREALERYANTRDALDAAAAQVWTQNGLRFALVPVDELSGLRDSLGVPGPLERTWWGVTTTWSHMAKGVPFGAQRLETDAGPLLLGAGRMALIGRAWPAPGISGPVLRVEFCPQFLRSEASARTFAARLAKRLEAGSEPPSDLDAGPVFERLLLRGSIPRGHALVITAIDREHSISEVGPVQTGSSIGETMLSAIGPDGAIRPVGLVVVPVLPEWLSLDGG